MKLVGDLTGKYRLSIYSEIVELSKGKIYIVKSSLDDRIYIKKVLDHENYSIYKKIQTLSIVNIPKIYELISLDDKLVVIEEYINGSSLKEILNKSKIISEDKVIKYTLELINIIDKFHSCDSPIIHKDINPSNIMINNDGILKLIDFDISRVHRNDKNTDTHILGTYGYAAPEQFGFNQTDARTDIFSLGVTMNMMLVGKLPNEELYKGQLSKIIFKCIELDPDKRFQNVNELRGKLLKINKKYNKIKDNELSFTSSVACKLPGFRSGNLLFKIIAFLWYFILIMIFLGLCYEEYMSEDRITDIIMSLFLFFITLFYGNFNNIKSKLPVLRSKNIFIKILGYIMYTFLLLIVLSRII